jgi:hypothetical protein
VLDLERKKITKEEGLKAQRAMQALEVKEAGGVKSEDVNFVVSQLSFQCPCETLQKGKMAQS